MGLLTGELIEKVRCVLWDVIFSILRTSIMTNNSCHDKKQINSLNRIPVYVHPYNGSIVGCGGKSCR